VVNGHNRICHIVTGRGRDQWDHWLVTPNASVFFRESPVRNVGTSFVHEINAISTCDNEAADDTATIFAVEGIVQTHVHGTYDTGKVIPFSNGAM
jgi:hypothetical protein